MLRPVRACDFLSLQVRARGKNKTQSGALTVADPNNGLKLHTRWRKINRRLFQLARAREQKSLFFWSRGVCGCRVESNAPATQRERFVWLRRKRAPLSLAIAPPCFTTFGCQTQRSPREALVGCTTLPHSQLSTENPSHNASPKDMALRG